MIRKLIVVFGLILLYLATGKPQETKAVNCGFYYGDIYIFCTNETRLIFCDDSLRDWGVDEYVITIGGQSKTIKRWTCGGENYMPGTDISADWVGDFYIAHYELGESFSAYCIGEAQYMVPFPLEHDNENVPIDLFLCLDYFPYIP